MQKPNTKANSKSGVLLVEDDRADITMLKRTLQRCGIEEISVLRTIQEVSEYIKGTGSFTPREKFPLPKVMFIDVNLPDGDAREAMTGWRKQLGKDTLLILMTGSLRPKVLQEAYTQGADTFIGKPVSEADIENIKAFYAPFFS